MSLLLQIQPVAQQIADAISGVLGIEVIIVDDSLARIAGTGDHPIKIGEKVTGKSIYHSVIQAKKEFIITDNNTAEKCSSCEIRSSCKQLAELCCPIILGTEVVGVIGLLAYSPEHRQDFLNKTDHLLAFIRRMADLIAAKAAQTANTHRLLVMKNQLETVLNFVAEGVLAIDNMAKITNINYAAEKMLSVKARDIIGFHINEVFPGTSISEVLLSGVGFPAREVSIWQKGKHHHYIVNATPMIIDGIIKGVVATFKTVSDQLEPTTRQRNTKITFDGIITTNKLMLAVKAEARKAAETSSTILITGESGTGKDILAQAIHNESPRNSKPFVAINCAAIPEHLLESELFGYEEGSFTGAKKGGKPGKFQLAHGGTLFLDEIGDMSLSLQAKILRVIQEKAVEPVGSIKTRPVDVRIIAATNRDIEHLIAKGQFREDLFYRLNVFLFTLPPLRDRPEDIVLLANHLLQKHALTHGKELKFFATDTQKVLQQYSWPGNIRELENTIERAVIRASGDKIQRDDLPVKIQLYKPMPFFNSPEKQSIIEALKMFGESVPGKQKAAAYLGIGIATLYRKIKKYNITSVT